MRRTHRLAPQCRLTWPRPRPRSSGPGLAVRQSAGGADKGHTGSRRGVRGAVQCDAVSTERPPWDPIKPSVPSFTPGEASHPPLTRLLAETFTAASLPPQTGGSNSMYLPSALRLVHPRWPIPFLTLLIPKGSYSRKKKGVNFNGVGAVREAGGGERRRAARWKPPDPKIARPGLFWVWGLRFFSDAKEKARNKVGSREGLQVPAHFHTFLAF